MHWKHKFLNTCLYFTRFQCLIISYLVFFSSPLTGVLASAFASLLSIWYIAARVILLSCKPDQVTHLLKLSSGFSWLWEIKATVKAKAITKTYKSLHVWPPLHLLSHPLLVLTYIILLQLNWTSCFFSNWNGIFLPQDLSLKHYAT